jgi:cell filamentation protein
LPISNINYFCSIHKHLFKDLYTWAGKLRKIHISKGSTRFANFSYIITSWDDLVEPKVNNLTNSKNKIQLLAEIWGDINAIHPFREGNGRVCRLYIAKLASLHGLPIDFSNITHKEKLNASTQSIKGKLNLIIKLINKSLI